MILSYPLISKNYLLYNQLQVSKYTANSIKETDEMSILDFYEITKGLSDILEKDPLYLDLKQINENIISLGKLMVRIQESFK